MKDWESVPLEALAAKEPNSFVDGPFGSNLKAGEYTDAGVPIIRLQNIRPNVFLSKQIKFISEQKAKTLSRHSYRPGDLVIAKLGDPCGMACVLPEEAGEGRIVADVVRFRGQKDKVEHQFLSYYINSPLGRAEIGRDAKGATRQRVNLANFKTLNIPLPPLREQRRIAAILDQADALRVKRREALAQLDILTQSIFIEMFGNPARNPKGWPICKIGDLLESSSYGTSEKSSSEGRFPVLRMNNITRSGEIDLSDLKYMDLAEVEYDRYLVKYGDVLFNRTNSADLVGKTAIYRHAESIAYAGYLIRLRTNADNDPEYLGGFLNTAFAKKMLRGMCKSIIGMANINATEVRAMRIGKPPLAIQREFGQRIKAVEKEKETYRKSLAELNTLFASLQHRAFRGKL